MDFKFDLDFLWYTDNGLSIWDKDYETILNRFDWKPCFVKVVDTMGVLSATAQNLSRVITSASSLLHSNQRLYIFSSNKRKVCGILKVGTKKLFVHDPCHKYSQIEPLCVLDFYIHESCQRQGIGKLLFEFMTHCEKAQPSAIAYDAPSKKLLSFLGNHYGLTKYNPQNCKFVIFHDYWQITEQYKFHPLPTDSVVKGYIAKAKDIPNPNEHGNVSFPDTANHRNSNDSTHFNSDKTNDNDSHSLENESKTLEHQNTTFAAMDRSDANLATQDCRHANKNQAMLPISPQNPHNVAKHIINSLPNHTNTANNSIAGGGRRRQPINHRSRQSLIGSILAPDLNEQVKTNKPNKPNNHQNRNGNANRTNTLGPDWSAIETAKKIKARNHESQSVFQSLSFETTDPTVIQGHPLSHHSKPQRAAFSDANAVLKKYGRSQNGTACASPKMEHTLQQSIDSAKATRGTGDHKTQLQNIQNQIRETRNRIAESEKKIYDFHLKNNQSQYSIIDSRNKRSTLIKNAYKTLQDGS